MQGMIDIPEGLQTRLCVLGADMLKEVPTTFRSLWPDGTAVIVADENTWRAAGQSVADFLRETGIPQDEPVIFPAEPRLHADDRHSQNLRERIAGKVAIAVGGGTINDICKLATEYAGNHGYLCVATAASVDGFTSYGAAMTVHGFKKTMPCAAPMAILADTGVVGSAPDELTASGYADLAAKIPAGADWFIADQLGEHPMAPDVWQLVQPELRDWLSDPEGLRDKRPEPLRKLFKGLAMTGFAVRFSRGSRAASGAAGRRSHGAAVEGRRQDGLEPSHGFKVAIGTLMTTALMTETFALDPEEIAVRAAHHHGPSHAERGAMIDACLAGSAFHADTRRIALDKLLTGGDLAVRRAAIITGWETMRTKVMDQLIPFDELKRRFAVLGAPTEPAHIGASRESLCRAVIVAAMIRKRYTILDLLFELGLLEDMLDIVLSKDYFSDFA